MTAASDKQHKENDNAIYNQRSLKQVWRMES